MGKAKKEALVWSDEAGCMVQCCFACRDEGRGMWPFQSKQQSTTGHSWCANPACPRYWERKADTAKRKGFRDAAAWNRLRERSRLRSRSRSRNERSRLRSRSPSPGPPSFAGTTGVTLQERQERIFPTSAASRLRLRSRSPPRSGTARERGVTRDRDRDLIEGRIAPETDRDLEIIRQNELIAHQLTDAGQHQQVSRGSSSGLTSGARFVAKPISSAIPPTSRRSLAKAAAVPVSRGSKPPGAPPPSTVGVNLGEIELGALSPKTCPPEPAPDATPEERRAALRARLEFQRGSRFRQQQAHRAGVPWKDIPGDHKARPHLGWTDTTKAAPTKPIPKGSVQTAVVTPTTPPKPVGTAISTLLQDSQETVEDPATEGDLFFRDEQEQEQESPNDVSDSEVQQLCADFQEKQRQAKEAELQAKEEELQAKEEELQAKEEELQAEEEEQILEKKEEDESANEEEVTDVAKPVVAPKDPPLEPPPITAFIQAHVMATTPTLTTTPKAAKTGTPPTSSSSSTPSDNTLQNRLRAVQAADPAEPPVTLSAILPPRPKSTTAQVSEARAKQAARVRQVIEKLKGNPMHPFPRR